MFIQCTLIPQAAPSKAWVYSRSPAGVAGSNPTGVWTSVFCECWVLCRLRKVRRVDPLSRGFLPVCLSVISKLQQWAGLSLRSKLSNTTCKIIGIKALKGSVLFLHLPLSFSFDPPALQWARASSFTRSVDHTQRSATLGRIFSGRVISSSQRHLPENTQHSQQTDIHDPGWILTHNPS